MIGDQSGEFAKVAIGYGGEDVIGGVEEGNMMRSDGGVRGWDSESRRCVLGEDHCLCDGSPP